MSKFKKVIFHMTYPIACILSTVDCFVETRLFLYISIPLFMLSVVLFFIQLFGEIRAKK